MNWITNSVNFRFSDEEMNKKYEKKDRLGRGCWKVDNATHQIIFYPVDSAVSFVNLRWIAPSALWTNGPKSLKVTSWKIDITDFPLNLATELP